MHINIQEILDIQIFQIVFPILVNDTSSSFCLREFKLCLWLTKLCTFKIGIEEMETKE